MGISRSVSLGYGILIPVEEAPDFLKSEYGDVDEESASAWLETADLPHLGVCVCGNFMSGEEYVFFYAEGSQLLHLDAYDLESDPYELEDTGENGAEEVELKRLRDMFGLHQELIGWKLIGNTS